MIHIWGKPACPSCTKAKALCEQRGYQFEYLELGKDFDRDAVLTEFPEARTFPQIVVNGQKIGGYEQFTKYIEDTGYTGTGHSL
jgi:glutaredoxin 3